jgi:RNA-directed DNA polymerase
LVNTDASPLEWPLLGQAERRVLEIQAKLHLWAGRDAARRFDDLFNLVTDPAFLMVAWERVRMNTGARTAGGGRHDRSLHPGGAGPGGIPGRTAS